MKMNSAAPLLLRSPLSACVICLSLLLQISPHLQAGEPFRLTSLAGKSIEVELISIDHDKDIVQFRRLSDDRVFTTKIAIFNPLTQLKLRLRNVRNGKDTSSPTQLFAETESAQKSPDNSRRPGF